MGVNQLSNKPYRDDARAKFFDRYGEEAFLNGEVRSTRFRKDRGDGSPAYIGRVDGSLNKEHNDTQFPGRAISFVANTNRGVIASNSFGLIGEVTLSVWFKADSFSNNPTLFKGNVDSIRVFNSNSIVFQANTTSPGSSISFSFPTFSTGVWYHVLFLSDQPNNNYRAFVNAVESSSGTVSFSSAGFQLTAINRLGNFNNISSVTLTGNMNGCGYWSRQLSASEITEVFNHRIPLTDCEFFLPLEQENTNTTVYTSVSTVNYTFSIENSDNTEWVTDDDLDYSFLNENGYSVDGGLIIPASLNNEDQDAIGNALQFPGTLAPRAQMVNAPAVNLNNTDQSIRIENASTNLFQLGTANWRFEYKIFLTDTGEASLATNLYPNAGGWSFYIPTTPKTLTLFYRPVSSPVAFTTTPSQTIPTNRWVDIIIERTDANTVVYTIDGVSENTTVSAPTFDLGLATSTENYVMPPLNSAGGFFGGNIAFASFTGQNGSYEFNFSEGAGDVLYNPLNSTTALLVNFSSSTSWTTQDVFHYSFYNGYWSYTNGGNEVTLPIDAGSTVTIDFVVYTRQSFVRGYKDSKAWNGQSDFQFPNIPEIPSTLRGNTYTQNQIETGGLTLAASRTSGGATKSILVTNVALTTEQKNREGFNNT